MPVGDWERANGCAWPHGGHAPVWPDDYPPACDCNPPSHTVEQAQADGSWHSRSCPEHPGNHSAPHRPTAMLSEADIADTVAAIDVALDPEPQYRADHDLADRWRALRQRLWDASQRRLS